MFRADRAGDTSAVIHWVISGRADGGSDTYQVVIDDGACTTSATADRDTRLTLSMGAVEFLKVISGAGNPMMMFMTGKVKAKGDLGLAAEHRQPLRGAEGLSARRGRGPATASSAGGGQDGIVIRSSTAASAMSLR